MMPSIFSMEQSSSTASEKLSSCMEDKTTSNIPVNISECRVIENDLSTCVFIEEENKSNALKESPGDIVKLENKYNLKNQLEGNDFLPNIVENSNSHGDKVINNLQAESEIESKPSNIVFDSSNAKVIMKVTESDSLFHFNICNDGYESTDESDDENTNNLNQIDTDKYDKINKASIIDRSITAGGQGQGTDDKVLYTVIVTDDSEGNHKSADGSKPGTFLHINKLSTALRKGEAKKKVTVAAATGGKNICKQESEKSNFEIPDLNETFAKLKMVKKSGEVEEITHTFQQWNICSSAGHSSDEDADGDDEDYDDVDDDDAACEGDDENDDNDEDVCAPAEILVPKNPVPRKKFTDRSTVQPYQQRQTQNYISPEIQSKEVNDFFKNLTLSEIDKLFNVMDQSGDVMGLTPFNQQDNQDQYISPCGITELNIPVTEDDRIEYMSKQNRTPSVTSDLGSSPGRYDFSPGSNFSPEGPSQKFSSDSDTEFFNDNSIDERMSKKAVDVNKSLKDDNVNGVKSGANNKENILGSVINVHLNTIHYSGCTVHPSPQSQLHGMTRNSMDRGLQMVPSIGQDNSLPKVITIPVSGKKVGLPNIQPRPGPVYETEMSRPGMERLLKLCKSNERRVIEWIRVLVNKPGTQPNTETNLIQALKEIPCPEVWPERFIAHIYYIKRVLRNDKIFTMQDKNGSSPLRIAALMHNKEPLMARCIADCIVETTHKLEDADENKESILHELAALGDSHVSVFAELLNVKIDGRPAFNVNRINRFKMTPLHIAVAKSTTGGGFLATVRLLVQHGANLEEKDNNGCTPIHHALQNKYDVSILKVLLMSPSSWVAVHIANNEGNTPLHLACANNSALFKNQQEAVRLLINSGARNRRTNFPQHKLSPLSLVLPERKDVIKKLIQN